MAEQSKTATATGTATGKAARSSSAVRTTTDAPVVSGRESSATSASGTSTVDAAPPKPQVEYGPRLNVVLSVDTVARAFQEATDSQSVRYIQYVLHDRGFEPGNDQGQVDYDTRRAYADFQRSINERPTGVPTAYSLNVLGFDVT